MTRVFAIATAIFIASSTGALAHSSLGGTGSVAHGFAHPLTGWDHAVTMIAVGVLAARLGGRAVWAVPLSFLAMMIAGGLLGVGGVNVPFVETGIFASIVVIGAAAVLPVRMSTALAMGLAGLFAVFHGHAHGTEMPEALGATGYGLGFLGATAALHALGAVAGLAGGRALKRA